MQLVRPKPRYQKRFPVRQLFREQVPELQLGQEQEDGILCAAAYRTAAAVACRRYLQEMLEFLVLNLRLRGEQMDAELEIEGETAEDTAVHGVPSVLEAVDLLGIRHREVEGPNTLRGVHANLAWEEPVVHCSPSNHCPEEAVHEEDTHSPLRRHHRTSLAEEEVLDCHKERVARLHNHKDKEHDEVPSMHPLCDEVESLLPVEPW